MQIANQRGPGRPVCIHRQGRPPFGPDQSSRSPKKMISDGSELLELPQRRPLRGRSAFPRSHSHLQLPAEVVCQYVREEKHLIRDPLPAWNVTKLALRLQLGKDRLLGSSAIVKGCDGTSLRALIGDDHFELVAIDLRNEQVQLDRPSLADGGARTDDQEATGLTPDLRLPRQLEVRDLRVEAMPSCATLNQFFELNEAPKWHGDAVLRSQILEEPHHRLTEEGTVNSHFNAGIRQDAANLENTGSQELLSTVRIVGIPRAMEDIENLARLSDGTKQRKIATFSFVSRIESDRSALCPSTGVDHRAVKVERHTGKAQLRQAFQDQLSYQPAKPLDTWEIESCQHPAHGRHIGQPFELEDSLDHRVVTVEADVSQVAISQQQMHDQTQDEGGIGVGAACLKVPKAAAQSCAQIEPRDQSLKEDQPREGSQLLFLETKIRHAVGFELDVQAMRRLQNPADPRQVWCSGKRASSQFARREPRLDRERIVFRVIPRVVSLPPFADLCERQARGRTGKTALLPRV